MVGITIANEQAVAAGAASLPDPASPGGIDWLFSGLLFVPAVATAAPTEDTVFYSATMERDLRSQRKLNENNSDVLMMVTDETGIVINVTIVANTLIRLP